MKKENELLREVLLVAAGEALGVGLMFGVFAMLDKLDAQVLWGGALGWLLAVVYISMMAVGVALAAKKAAGQDVRGGQASASSAMLLRYLVLLGALVVAGKSEKVNMIAAVVPLLFIRPILSVGELFRKKEEAS